MQAGSSAKAVLKCIAPQFVVADVVATSEYYRDVLGFEILGFFADPPVYAMVARDGVEIHFGKAGGPSAGVPDLPSRRLGSDAYIWVDDIFTLLLYSTNLRDPGQILSRDRSNGPMRAPKWSYETVMGSHSCLEIETRSNHPLLPNRSFRRLTAV